MITVRVRARVHPKVKQAFQVVEDAATRTRWDREHGRLAEAGKLAGRAMGMARSILRDVPESEYVSAEVVSSEV